MNINYLSHGFALENISVTALESLFYWEMNIEVECTSLTPFYAYIHTYVIPEASGTCPVFDLSFWGFFFFKLFF